MNLATVLAVEEGIRPISLGRLSLVALPALAVVWLMHRWSLGAKGAIYALSRMLAQLLLVGFLLVHIFAAEGPWIVLAIMGVMTLTASWIALRTVPMRRKQLFGKSLLAVALGGGGTLAWISFGVLDLTPWYSPRYLIPIAGMVFSAALNSVSLAAERIFSELERGEKPEVARSTAFRAAMIPITNSLFAVGLVSIPGMMTGQILSGIAPPVAARYQIMVMCMIFGAAGLSAAIFLHMIYCWGCEDPEPVTGIDPDVD
ncbi:MAG: ABC transporter permease [Planctomycetota bacterium]|nr:ABC transporter permease [Planctomycetota bacterium]